MMNPDEGPFAMDLAHGDDDWTPTPHGRWQSSMADVPRTLRRMDENGYEARVVASTSGPFRDDYFEDPTFLEEIERVEGSYEVRDGVRYETLAVIHGKLRAWSPPSTAHLPGRDEQ